jgi:hypothetical protein
MSTHAISPLAYERLPKHLRSGMRRYIEDGIETGSFLRAALENDFTQVFARCGDDLSRTDIENIVRFLLFEAPPDAWGSPAKVQAWIILHAKQSEASR